ncbi:MAG TPA: hypothetical protein VFP97_17585 [Chitinophagaceae bacterium]|nr:hypothetical protein [Chitinophagaceae bacterium]
MNTVVVSIGDAIIEEFPEESVAPLFPEREVSLPEVPFVINRRFGIADLWKIRSTKRHFTFYR